MVIGFIFVFGLVRSNLNEAGDNIAENVYDHYQKTNALNIANSLCGIAVRMLSVDSDWTQWEGNYANVNMLSGVGRLAVSDADPNLGAGELSVVAEGRSGDFVARARIVALPQSLMPETQGALGIMGEDEDDIFDGYNFRVDGNDVNPDGTPGPEPPVPGIGVSDPLTEQALVDELTNEGSDTLVTGAGGAIPSVELLPDPIDIGAVAAQLGAKATMHYPWSPTPETFVAMFGPAIVWGTPGNPEIVYLQNNGTAYSDLVGAGILIIDGVRLLLLGQFRWEGLVIITGNGFLDHSLPQAPGAAGEIYGSVLVEAQTGSPEIEIAANVSGELNLQYSSAALNSLPSQLGLLTYSVRNWEEWPGRRVGN
jgi:hypothetical protein